MVLVTETIEKSCIHKILPVGCLIYSDSSSCPPACPFFIAGKAIIPHHYPSVRVDCINLQRVTGDSFLCLITGEWNTLNCLNCSSFKRARAISEYFLLHK